MELNRKKRVAKELLIFFSCLLIFGISLIGIYSYNFVFKNSINNLENSIATYATEIENLESPITPKISQQKWFFEKWNENTDFQSYDSYAELWDRIEYLQKKDSIEHKWNNEWNAKIINFTKNLGFENSNEFYDFIFQNSLNTDELKIKEKADIIRIEVNILQDKIQEKEQKIILYDIYYALLILIIVGTIAYPIRIIYYAIRWSINVLKTKP